MVQPVQSLVRAYPEFPTHTRQQASHLIMGQAVGIVGVMPVQVRWCASRRKVDESLVRAEPSMAVHLAERSGPDARHGTGDGIRTEDHGVPLRARIDPDEPGTTAHEQHPIRYGDPCHFPKLRHRTEGGSAMMGDLEVVGRDAREPAVRAHPDGTIQVHQMVREMLATGTFRTCGLEDPDHLSPCWVHDGHPVVRGHPDPAVIVMIDLEDTARWQFLRTGTGGGPGPGLQDRIEPVQPTSEGPHPEASRRAFVNVPDEVVGRPGIALAALPMTNEPGPVVPVQTILRGHPEESRAVLEQVVHGMLRETISSGQMLIMEHRALGHGRKCEERPRHGPEREPKQEMVHGSGGLSR